MRLRFDLALLVILVALPACGRLGCSERARRRTPSALVFRDAIVIEEEPLGGTPIRNAAVHLEAARRELAARRPTQVSLAADRALAELKLAARTRAGNAVDSLRRAVLDAVARAAEDSAAADRALADLAARCLALEE